MDRAPTTSVARDDVLERLVVDAQAVARDFDSLDRSVQSDLPSAIGNGRKERVDDGALIVRRRVVIQQPRRRC